MLAAGAARNQQKPERPRAHTFPTGPKQKRSPVSRQEIWLRNRESKILHRKILSIAHISHQDTRNREHMFLDQKSQSRARNFAREKHNRQHALQHQEKHNRQRTFQHQEKFFAPGKTQGFT